MADGCLRGRIRFKASKVNRARVDGNTPACMGNANLIWRIIKE